MQKKRTKGTFFSRFVSGKQFSMRRRWRCHLSLNAQWNPNRVPLSLASLTLALAWANTATTLASACGSRPFRDAENSERNKRVVAKKRGGGGVSRDASWWFRCCRPTTRKYRQTNEIGWEKNTEELLGPYKETASTDYPSNGCAPTIRFEMKLVTCVAFGQLANSVSCPFDRPFDNRIHFSTMAAYSAK